MEPEDGRIEGRRAGGGEPARDRRTGRGAAAERIRNQSQWVDLQLREAVERGDFEDLPGFGKPIEGLGATHDPDWWVKRLVEREQLHLLPPALALRAEDAELEGRLDRLGSAAEVRRAVEDFNQRVRHTLYSNPGGPPVVTARREVAEEVRRWEERRTTRIAAARASDVPDPEPDADRRRWWRRWWRHR